jgi:aspartyl-tRNA synthetase
LSWVSRIGITDQERAAMADAVAQAQACAERINQQAGTGEEPLFSVAAVRNRTREGRTARIHPLAEKGEFFKNAPAEKGGFFKTAAVLD